jgi:mannose-6-phosphate isomerase
MQDKNLYKFPLKLISNRVHRPFVGGKSIDVWEKNPEPKDNHYGERWIASLVDARNPESKMDEGLSKFIDHDKTMTLKEVIAQNPEAFLGANHVEAYGVNLAVLVKALDSYSRLLIQVHPNQEKAKSLFDSQFGKTEAWYIIGTRTIDGEEPYILFGFKEGITREKYIKLFEAQDIQALEACMHRFPVKEGDIFLIEGGVPHAIGSGCFLIEIQEPTDYTIRVEKTAPDGRNVDDFSCHQGLGFKAMFDCFAFEGYSREQISEKYKIITKVLYSGSNAEVFGLITEEHTALFSMEKLTIYTELEFQKKEKFAVAIVLKGNGRLSCNGYEVVLNQADELFIPYGAKELLWINESTNPLEIIVCLPPKS